MKPYFKERPIGIYCLYHSNRKQKTEIIVGIDVIQVENQNRVSWRIGIYLLNKLLYLPYN